jgi:general secretion pathway protein G
MRELALEKIDQLNTSTMERNRRDRYPQRGGFTLLEVLIVLFILMTLASLAVVTLRGTQVRAQREATFTYVNTLKGAVDRYTLHVGRPPTTEQGLAALFAAPPDLQNPGSWAGPYLEARATTIDPWGNEYQYISPGRDGREFDIWSFGPDGTDGTDDDIGSWMPSL